MFILIVIILKSIIRDILCIMKYELPIELIPILLLIYISIIGLISNTYHTNNIYNFTY